MNANDTWGEIRAWCAAHGKVTAVVIALAFGVLAGLLMR